MLIIKARPKPKILTEEQSFLKGQRKLFYGGGDWLKG